MTLHVTTPDERPDGPGDTAAGQDATPGGTRQVRPADGLLALVPAAVRQDPGTGEGPLPAPARWAAEFAGTALVVFAGLGAGMFATEVVDSALGFDLGLVAALAATALFALVVLGSTAPRANAVLAPLAMGAAFTLLLTVTAPSDGGALNPARSTGAAVVAGAAHLSQLWLFWAAPLLGGLLAGLAHRVAGPVRTRATAGTTDPSRSAAGSRTADPTVAARRS